MDQLILDTELSEVKINDALNSIKKCINNLEQELKDSEELLNTTKTQQDALNNDIKLDKNHINKLKSEKENIQSECKILQSTVLKLLSENRSLNTDIKINDNSSCHTFQLAEINKRVEDGHETLRYYKHLTGCRFDFAVSDSYIKGVITNHRDYVKSFKYPFDTDDIKEKLWTNIYNSIKHHIFNIENK